MAVDTQYISERDFNLKFKNYLRDFYTYQFKNKDLDFYNKGTFAEARMAAASILSFVSGYDVQSLLKLRMEDIIVGNDSVSVCIEKNADDEDAEFITLEKPLCEMFRYLYSPEKKAFFLTGNTGSPKAEKLQAEYERFYKACPSPKTTEKMYRYWAQIYLDEANETISNATYRNDSLRVQNLVKKMAGVTWKHGAILDFANSCAGNKDDKCVECITVDTRTLKENPFHLLYNYCNRYSSNDDASCGEHFALIYALILYFNLGIKVRKTNVSEPACDQTDELNEALVLLTEYFHSEGRHSNDVSKWANFSDEDKILFAYIAIEKFMEAKGDVSEITACNYESVYTYLIENKKRIVYSDNRFLIEDDTETCIDIDRLYEFYEGFVTQQFSIQRKQFFNVVKSLVKIGLFEEKKELRLELKRKKACSYCFSHRINEILAELDCSDFKLIEKVSQRAYILRYNSITDDAVIRRLREEIKEKCTGWECKTSSRVYCQLSSACLSDILSESTDLQKRFSDMISFFAQTTPLGEIGHFISRFLPEAELPIFYKHNYIIKALNDYNLIDLLYAVKKKKWVKIECRSPLSEHQYQQFVCFPLEIREDAANGRQLLLYYHPGYRSVSSVRVDFIDNIVVGEYEKPYYFDEDILRAGKLIRYTWGNDFDGFCEGNVKADIKPGKVKFVVALDKKNEPYIIARIKKELPRGTIEEKEQNENIIHAEIVVDIVNPFSMLHWMRSYTTRIVSIEIMHNCFADDIMRSYKMYQLPSQERISLALSENPTQMIEGFDDRFTPCEGLHDQLFNEFFNVSFLKLGDILSDILHIRHTDAAFISSKKQEYLDAFIFDDSERTRAVRTKRELQAESFIKNFIEKNDSIFAFMSKEGIASIKDLIPLTKTEIQWLINILNHPFAVCFLEKDEIKALEERLPEPDLFDINDDIVLCNQAVDIREYYDKSDYANNLRTIINAIRSNVRLDAFGMTRFGTRKPYEGFAPVYIEYSKKDNRFRIRGILGESDIFTINLERIVSVSLTEDALELQKIKKDVEAADSDNIRSLKVYFNDVDNIPERILSEFSCYKKECIRFGNGKYCMTLFYNSLDDNEIVIRLLSYGSLITVAEDDGTVLSEIKTRLKKQLTLSHMIHKTTDNVFEEAEIEYEK